MKTHCHHCQNENDESEIFCGLCRKRTVLDQSGRHNPAPRIKQVIPIVFQPDTLFNGRTQVRVLRKDVQEGREIVKVIHSGVVIQKNTHFARVYNPLTPDAGGDISAEMSQMFPIKSPRCWIEIVGEQEVQTKIPPIFR